MRYHAPMAEHVLEMRNVTKRFPGVTALDGVRLAVRPGEIHALVGENGAGKSTLMKILAGAQPMDEGEILIDGMPVRIRTPHDAQALGDRKSTRLDSSHVQNSYIRKLLCALIKF